MTSITRHNLRVPTTQPILGRQKYFHFLAYSAILTEFVVGLNSKKIEKLFSHLFSYSMEPLFPAEQISSSKINVSQPPTGYAVQFMSVADVIPALLAGHDVVLLLHLVSLLHHLQCFRVKPRCLMLSLLKEKPRSMNMITTTKRRNLQWRDSFFSVAVDMIYFIC